MYKKENKKSIIETVTELTTPSDIVDYLKSPASFKQWAEKEQLKI